LFWDDLKPELRARSDHEHIGHSANAGLLSQRDPQQEDKGPDDVRDNTKWDATLKRDPLAEYVPRRDADRCANHERKPDPVQEQADHKLGDSASEGN